VKSTLIFDSAHDMVLIFLIFELIVYGLGLFMLYGDVCMKGMHRFFEMLH
jgi:hypothetical protein